MKRKILILTLFCTLAFSGCGSKALEEAKASAENYNTIAAAFNDSIVEYNTAVEEIEKVNSELQDAIDEAQESINKGEEPFDETTLDQLKDSLSDAADAKVDVPELIDEYEMVTVDEEAKSSELEEFKEQTDADAVKIAAYEIEETPEVPDYTDAIDALSDAKKVYADSVQSLKQVTAPSDKFVIERLQSVKTITAIEAVTEDHDPNGQLNKQGGYIGCIYFTDSQVDHSNLYIEDGKDGVIDVGTDGGGAVEVFKTVKEAENRDAYLATFDGGMFASGSHYVVGTCLIRTSDELSGTKQLELTDEITNALIKVK